MEGIIGEAYQIAGMLLHEHDISNMPEAVALLGLLAEVQVEQQRLGINAIHLFYAAEDV